LLSRIAQDLPQGKSTIRQNQHGTTVKHQRGQPYPQQAVYDFATFKYLFYAHRISHLDHIFSESRKLRNDNYNRTAIVSDRASLRDPGH
jgi:hypothetical protein